MVEVFVFILGQILGDVVIFGVELKHGSCCASLDLLAVVPAVAVTSALDDQLAAPEGHHVFNSEASFFEDVGSVAGVDKHRSGAVDV